MDEPMGEFDEDVKPDISELEAADNEDEDGRLETNIKDYKPDVSVKYKSELACPRDSHTQLTYRLRHVRTPARRHRRAIPTTPRV
jgi:hypothetical protein